MSDRDLVNELSDRELSSDDPRLPLMIEEIHKRNIRDVNFATPFWHIVSKMSVEEILQHGVYLLGTICPPKTLPQRLFSLLAPFIRQRKTEEALDFLLDLDRTYTIDLHKLLNDIQMYSPLPIQSRIASFKEFDSDERLKRKISKDPTDSYLIKTGLERPSTRSYFMENASPNDLFIVLTFGAPPEILEDFISIQMVKDSKWANLDWLEEVLITISPSLDEGLEDLLEAMIKFGLPVLSKIRSLLSSAQTSEDDHYLELLQNLLILIDPDQRLSQREAMVASQNLVRRRALELEEEEAQRKRARRQSDPKMAKCAHMNQVCQYTPLDLEDWCEHDEEFYFGPDSQNRCWDAKELLMHFESQMLMEKYENPLPQYPTDPWTRQPIPLRELEAFMRFCTDRRVSTEEVAPTFTNFFRYLTKKPEMDLEPIIGKWLEEIVDNVL